MFEENEEENEKDRCDELSFVLVAHHLSPSPGDEEIPRTAGKESRSMCDSHAWGGRKEMMAGAQAPGASHDARALKAPKKPRNLGPTPAKLGP